VNPFFAVLTRWAEAIANGSAQLDPLTRARLDRLAGRSIAIELDPPGEAATLYFDNHAIRLEPGIGSAPSAVVRGSPARMANAFFDSSAARSNLSIEGDELILEELRNIVRDFHPESLPPLERLVGAQAAQTLTSLVELGFAAVAALGRSLGEEGGRLVRAGARERYLTTVDFDALLTSMQALQIRVDRLKARTEIVERSLEPRHE
jgi:ubiquinone biosynthesis accessory factor UbiJ